MGRRILVTGLSSYWSGRVAQMLEAADNIDVIIGTVTADGEPALPLQRTEIARLESGFSPLVELIESTQVDTMVLADLIVDSSTLGARDLHEHNVIGTMNKLAAAGSKKGAVRQVVVRSSCLVYGTTERDPYRFRERDARPRPPRTRVERSIVEAETYVAEFVADHPEIDVSVLRMVDALGPDLITPVSALLTKPVVPGILGFDPLLQFVDTIDAVRALLFAVGRPLRGTLNVAADGRLPWSECASLAHKRFAPVLPPFFTEQAGALVGGLHWADLPAEVLGLLRHGRGVDNRQLKEAGFRYEYTSAGAVRRFAQGTARGLGIPRFVHARGR